VPHNHPLKAPPPHRTPPLTMHPSNTNPRPHTTPSPHRPTTLQPLQHKASSPPYTQKVCHKNSPHTTIPSHRNIMPTQDEKLTQGMFPTQSFLTHTPPTHQKESSLVVFITNITPLCRQGMSFTHSHSIIALHNFNNQCAFYEDMRTKVSMSEVAHERILLVRGWLLVNER